MKHIKKYENLNIDNFEIGDYVIVSPKFDAYNLIAKIKNKSNEQFDVDMIQDDKLIDTYIFLNEIARKANQKEINDFEFKLALIKYNL